MAYSVTALSPISIPDLNTLNPSNNETMRDAHDTFLALLCLSYLDIKITHHGVKVPATAAQAHYTNANANVMSTSIIVSVNEQCRNRVLYTCCRRFEKISG